MDIPPNPYGLVSMGTTLMACEYENGVVLGADSRTSTGSVVASPISDKITMVSDTVFCCRSGSAADTQCLTDLVRAQLLIFEQEHGHKATVETVANMFRKYCYQYRDSMSAGILVGGWDDVNGGQVYAVPLGGMITRIPMASGGSGSTYVQGFIDHNFKHNMKQNDAEKFILDAVAHAMYRDGSSGGIVRLATISAAGVDKKIFTGKDLPTFCEF